MLTSVLRGPLKEVACCWTDGVEFSGEMFVGTLAFRFTTESTSSFRWWPSLGYCCTGQRK